ncbi:MAG: hypothetical protein QG654_382 [Patescibacteria group bacterium]|nr:hypothetical protein [Patescibacteria group bacterium]
MDNIESLHQHGKLVISKESMGQKVILSADLAKEVEIAVIFVKEDDQELEAKVFIDHVLAHTNEDYYDTEDIFVYYALSECGGFLISGHVISSEGVKCPIEILSLGSGDFCVYKIDIESTFKPFNEPDTKPSLN